MLGHLWVNFDMLLFKSRCSVPQKWDFVQKNPQVSQTGRCQVASKQNNVLKTPPLAALVALFGTESISIRCFWLIKYFL